MTAPLVAPSPPRPKTPAPLVERARPGLRVVEVPRRSRTGFYAAAIVVVLFGSLFLNAGFHTVLVSSQQRLDTLHGQVLEQEKLNQRARLQVATMESPERIVQAATRNHMVLPDEVHWLSPGPGPGSAIASTSKRVAPPVTTIGGPGSSNTGELANAQAPSPPGNGTTVPTPGGR